ncbi:hypothetical protein, partial [Bacillus manliponensis]|uniref:hypothetical protein n=2 Tax=Bacillus manliponensis TaxID=574376 RepID=UPI0030846A0C
GLRFMKFLCNVGKWVYAETEEQAKEYYKEQTGFSDEDLNECYEGEVSLQDKMYVEWNELSEEERQHCHTMLQYGDTSFV